MRRFSVCIPILLYALSISSCSVWEDRTLCPCRLNITVPWEGGVLVDIFSESAGYEELVSSRGYGQKVEKLVPKGEYCLTATGGGGTVFFENARMVIPFGSQSDSVYVCRSTLDCNGDYAFENVKLHKQFAGLLLKFEDLPETAAVCVKGNVAGLDFRSLSPLPGDFEYRPAIDRVSACAMVLLPRQRDDSAVLELYFGSSGEAVRSFRIGEIIAEAGYDWSEEDLQDILVLVSGSPENIRLEVARWNGGDVYEMEF